MKYLLLALMWAGYCALHSYLISIRFTNMLNRVLKKYYSFYRLFYVLISIFLLIPLLNFSEQSDNNVIIIYGHYLDILRTVLTYGSLLMFIWAFFIDYDFLLFFGFRQILNFGKTQVQKPSEGFKKSGLLGIVRHPMYLALIVYLWCQTFKMADIVVSTVLTIYIIIGTMLEEKKLVLEFGETYIKYQEEVPMLIPFTKIKRRK
jgi:protein-S-isoprenylcysteine O-methyltransferase Ste14